jgi:hypothetical protein
MGMDNNNNNRDIRVNINNKRLRILDIHQRMAVNNQQRVQRQLLRLI